MGATARSVGREDGLTLAEVLVALSVLVVAATMTLAAYDGLRRCFRQGENLTEQQQSLRVAFDRVATHVRRAGFNINPDGDARRPGEAIEAAYATAIVVRADLDSDDPSERTSPEASLAGGASRTVSVGNDEIVAYVLAKPDGSSPDTLTFEADVRDVPRDGVVEPVRIPNVALAHDDPPYTLYRIALSNDVSRWGTGGFFTRTPVADHVASLGLRYFDRAGSRIDGSSDGPGGDDDDASRRQRAGIRRIEMRLVVLTRDPDPRWEDADDASPRTRRHRKLALTGDVTPRNLGLTGAVDPGPPEG